MARSTETEELYLLNRDKAEGDRLNSQHSLITRVFRGNLLDPSIPREGIKRVADVATGTGIWLLSLRTQLSDPTIQYTGFDISAAQFPSPPPSNTKFEVADITKGFGAEYQGVFDVVHVRLLVLALSVEEIRGAVGRVLGLLKPGGYLQWDDIDYTNPLFPLSSTPSPTYQTTTQLFERGLRSQPWSMQISCDIYASLLQHSIVPKNIRVTNHTANCFQDEELRKDCELWHREAVKAIFPVLMRRMGMSEGEIEGVVGGYLEDCAVLAGRGAVFPVPMVPVVARK